MKPRRRTGGLGGAGRSSDKAKLRESEQRRGRDRKHYERDLAFFRSTMKKDTPTITKMAMPAENKMTRLSMASAPPVDNGRDYEREGRESDPKNEDNALKSLGSDELANHQGSECDLGQVVDRLRQVLPPPHG